MKKFVSVVTVLSLLLSINQLTAKQVVAEECIPFTQAPNLYSVNRTASHSATLYFTPLNDSIEKYIIDYGLSADDRRYSIHVDHGPSTGAIAHTINGLEPTFTYYYTVSAVNPCSQSPWSNWVSDAPSSATESAKIIQNPDQPIEAPGSPVAIIGVILTSALTAGGIAFYRKS